jgi:predicted amidophosphoribosyltransferase
VSVRAAPPVAPGARSSTVYEGSEACDQCQPVSARGRTYCVVCGLTLAGAVRLLGRLLS